MGAGPYFLRDLRPRLGLFLALARQLPHILRGLQIGGVRARPLYRRYQLLRVVQQRTGAQVVSVPGLALLVSGEQRGLERLQQRVGPHIGIGVVDESAGFIVTVGVDM